MIEDKIANNQELILNLPAESIAIASKKFSRNVKLATAAAALVAFSTLYYTLLRKHVMFYNAETAYIQNSIKCQKEPENSLMPGCSNNVYCTEKDINFEKLNSYYKLTKACINEKEHFMFNVSKESMNKEVAKYLNSNSYPKQVFDKLYFKLFV